MVDQLPEIIQEIENQENPLNICTQLGLCTATSIPMISRKNPLVQDPPVLKACYDCEIVVKYIEGWLFENSTIAEIIVEVDQLCSYVADFSETCDSLVEYGVEAAIQYIMTNEDPETLCTQIGQC